MNTIEYLEAAQKATGAENDNQLGKALGLKNNRVSDYKKGYRRPDEYACIRIAVATGADPAKVIAEIAVEWEKNEKKREFWLNFLSRAASLNAIIAGLICTGLWCHAPDLNAMTMTSDIKKEKSITYQHIIRSTGSFGQTGIGLVFAARRDESRDICIVTRQGVIDRVEFVIVTKRSISFIVQQDFHDIIVSVFRS